MGKNEDRNLQQIEQSVESWNSQGHPGFLCGRCWVVLSSFSNEFSFRCVFVLFLSLSVLLPGIFWLLPLRSSKSGFDAKQAIKLSAPVYAYFTLEKPVSELVRHIEKLEYDIYEEIGVPDTKNLFVQLTNRNGSTMSSPTIVQASVMSDGFGGLLPQRLKQLAQTITDSPAKNLGLNNSVFGKVKSISLSSCLNGTLHPTPPTPLPAPSPGPSMSWRPTFSPTPASKKHHLPACPKCKSAAPSGHSPIHSPGPGGGSYPTFPPSISPEPSSSAAHPRPPCPYTRNAIPPSSSPRSHSSRISNHPPLMSPGSKLSPDLPPLPSVSYSSHHGQGMDSTKGPVSAPPAQPPPAQSPSCKNICLSEYTMPHMLTAQLCTVNKRPQLFHKRCLSIKHHPRFFCRTIGLD
ncbi:hypothetical protein V6N11_073173 [Hibiscus sabdariffa]|uniref:DUF7036 domain-containing protein n=1 Tax=Hibiscus sabdariffa TaxID=183260 RepID=A0ABR1ZVC4_9ROSI